MPWVLAHAAQIAHVPGRKTDVKDCVGIAPLLEHGLIRGRVVPPGPIRELRDLTRYRKALSQERTRAATRLHTVLEDAGIKLASVASHVLGVSGRAMLDALVAGTTDPAVVADVARGRLRKTLPAVRQALVGRFHGHHAFLLAQILASVGNMSTPRRRSPPRGPHPHDIMKRAFSRVAPPSIKHDGMRSRDA